MADSPISQLKTHYSLEWESLNDTLRQQLKSDVSDVVSLGEYIIEGGGKRTRPLLSIMTAQLLNGAISPEDPLFAKVITASAVIELIHTATLLHDDVVDESDQRRGRPTAHQLFGNQQSILVGDFIYTRAFQLMVSLDDMAILSLMANVTNAIAEGEVLQLQLKGQLDIDMAQYFEVIHRKTACLFGAACAICGHLTQQSDAVITHLTAYGNAVGTAFQLQDDWLDYFGDETAIGKRLGDDLNEGKLTFPIIHARTLADAPQRRWLDQLLASETPCSESDWGTLLALLADTGAPEAMAKVIDEHVSIALSALQALPQTSATEHLAALAKFSGQRNA